MRNNFAVLIGLTATALSAHAQELPRAAAVPGGIAIVALTPDDRPAPVIYFAQHRVMVRRHARRWHAIVGLPLSLTPGQHALRLNENTAEPLSYSFAVRPKAYKEQHLNLRNKNMVEPTAEDLERIGRDQEVIQRAFATWTEEQVPSLPFSLPASGPISSVFGLKRFFNNEARQPHSGIDIAAPVGAPITAPSAGTVIGVDEFFFNGKTLFIDHGQGLVSMYNHLSRITVERGAHVKQRQKIGEVGRSGRVTGPHLHWTVSLNNSRVDPTLFLSTATQKPRQNR